MRTVRGTLLGYARAPGTCGELVQGQFSDNVDFLVTLPIDLWSAVQVEIAPGLRSITVCPESKSKTRQAVSMALEALGCPDAEVHVLVASEIPIGKGMASSTADIVAVCRATASALGRSLSPETISGIAGRIEPSDGVMYPGVVCYNHRAGRLIEPLGPLPPLDILVVDLGGEVDTLRFNTYPKRYSPADLITLQRAYEWVKAGVKTGDLALIGRAATLSGRVNQRLLPKPPLEVLIRLAEKNGALGVNVAHSGTVAGLLFGPGQRQVLQQARRDILANSELRPPRFLVVRTLTDAPPFIDTVVPCNTQERMMP